MAKQSTKTFKKKLVFGKLNSAATVIIQSACFGQASTVAAETVRGGQGVMAIANEGRAVGEGEEEEEDSSKHTDVQEVVRPKPQHTQSCMS